MRWIEDHLVRHQDSLQESRVFDMRAHLPGYYSSTWKSLYLLAGLMLLIVLYPFYRDYISVNDKYYY